MEIPSAITAELRRLTESLDDPGIDVADTLRRLAADASAAVDSYRGLSMTVQPAAGTAFTVTVMADRPEAAVRASLAIPLAAGESGHAAALLVLYAGRPGAFVDMAADISWLAGIPLGELVLDEHCDVDKRPGGGLDGLRSASIINQAVGILIGRGRSLDEARAFLAASAKADGIDRLAAAQRILDSLPRPGSTP